ncbi:hypothetical protein IFM89_005497 [Coptis chinensis]|uniref:BHLH domain-containing protein n=1 Tax=Coptis chinensis TaxID=261450 RepID=A0A835GUF1_9MAGN|nr:hypothetical protein IFM89_005497 [Coptis chinensis]
MGSLFNWNSGNTNIARLFDGFVGNNNTSLGHGVGALLSSTTTLVLDNERGELVRGNGKVGQKGKCEGKSIVALKNHSDAERRRRERINSHLNSLRSLVPCSEKMDKASLLAEVIDHVKELKRTTAEACKGFVIPMDVDEVRVEPHEDAMEGSFCIKVYLCCEDRPEIFSDLREALKTFNLKTVKAEISTLGGRMKTVFVMTGFKIENIDDPEVRRLLTASVHQALTSILEKYSGSPELSPRVLLSNKKRRLSPFESSSSSS